MNQKRQRIKTEDKLNLRCVSLAEATNALRSSYLSPSISQTQKDFLETIMGAAVWYLPELPGLFTGKMSRKARELCEQDSKHWGKLTKEHCYSRKRTGRDLLESKEPWTPATIREKYETVWGRYNRVTKKENRDLVPYQKQQLCAEDCYKAAGIELVEAPSKFLTKRLRERTIVEAHLSQVLPVE
jgi:hypothetical protein